MSGKRSGDSLASISILFVVLFLSTLHHASCSIYVKNIYNFGNIDNNGFTIYSPTSVGSGEYNSYLSNLFFNGSESYRLTTGIHANDVSVTLQQIAPAVYSVNYIIEYFNTTTMQSIGQCVLISGNNPKSAPPLVWTLPEPIYIFTQEGKQSSPLFNTNRKITKMECLLSCLMLTSDGKVFAQEFSFTNSYSDWTERFILTNYINEDNYTPYENVTIVDVQVVGYVGCETFFAVTNYGHVFSYGCKQNSIRGVNGANADHYDTTRMDSLSNIVSISGARGAYDAEMSSMGAIDSNGDLFTWGYNRKGALGLNDTTVENSITPRKVTLLPSKVKKVCYGLSYALVILEDGELYVFGDNESLQCDPNVSDPVIWVPRKMSAFTNVTDCYVFRSLSTSIVDGNLYSWGDLYAENVGHSGYVNLDKIEMNYGGNVTKVALTNSNGIAITLEGNAYVWGGTLEGILSKGEERQIQYPRKLTVSSISNASTVSVVSVRNGAYCSVLISKYDTNRTTADYWGACDRLFEPSSVPVPADSFTMSNITKQDIVSMEIGDKAAFALLSNGDLYGWGAPDSYSYPLTLSTIPQLYYSNVEKFAMLGSKNLFLLMRNGQVLGIGSNIDRLFGFGDNASQFFSSFTPVNTSILGTDERVVDLKGINDNTLVLLTNLGNVYGCGNNGIEKYLSLSSATTFGNFIRINENIKVRQLVTGASSSMVLISTNGQAYYVYGRPNVIAFPSSTDSYVVSAYSQDNSYYFITKKGNLYTGGKNYYFQVFPTRYYNPPIANPVLYPNNLYEGIPYLISTAPTRVSLFTRDEFTCFGYNSTSESACSSRGYCAGPNSCVCDEGYFGNECEMKSCFRSFNSYGNPLLVSDVFCKRINKLLK